MQDLLVLSHEDYRQLRQELKAAGLDLCYTVQLTRPLRLRWSPGRINDATLLAQVAQRRPSDPSYCLASVQCTRPGNWFRPDQLTVTFHAVSATQDAALQDYLATHTLWGKARPSPEPVAATHLHTTPTTYVQVALLLALITAVEVAVLYVPASLSPPRWAVFLVLTLLSVLKFGLVASFFMHLRSDHRLYAGLFAGGMVVALGTILALLALFREPAPPAPPPSAAYSVPVQATPHVEVSAPVSQTTAGGQVFVQHGCGGCHTVASLPAARGTLGPPLDGLAQRATRRIPGMQAEDYIRQSVEAPEAYVVKGYLKLMPPMRDQMPPQEFAALLSWLLTL